MLKFLQAVWGKPPSFPVAVPDEQAKVSAMRTNVDEARQRLEQEIARRA
jgi:hypothetical protein